ncbi:MAG: 2,3-bisphosphoglycerate-dependent phosphoglycerate mutase [Actinomycetota bacterium]|jgi:2,3-bisphosphoglycerate-dependent phosphoglycerate mutase
MAKLVLLRHGQSEWNLLNVFTGWQDPDITDQGRAEAIAGGERMRERGIEVDVAFTSLLRRAITTTHLALDACDRVWVPVHRHWRLNERHYGALQGLNKKETEEKHGEKQFKLWRRSYDVAPPAVDASSPHHPANDARYADVAPELLPSTECLKDVLERALPYWYDAIVPQLHGGKTVLVGAHGNSLRALAKHLLRISDEQIVELEIPTGVPWVFELNDDYSVNKETLLT